MTSAASVNAGGQAPGFSTQFCDVEVDPETGYVMDFGHLKRTVDEAVIRRLDRRHLNHDVDFLNGINPTAENIAAGIWKQLAPRVAPARFCSITVSSPPPSSVTLKRVAAPR